MAWRSGRVAAAALGALVLSLSGCGGEESPPPVNTPPITSKDAVGNVIDERCSAFGEGATAVFKPDATCAGCTATDVAKSVDSSDETYSTLESQTPNAGTLILRATAATGTVFPAGGNAAVSLSAAIARLGTDTTNVSTQGNQHWHFTIRTYLNDAVQNEDSGEISVSSDPNWRTIAGTVATLPFDSIEVAFDRPISTASGVEINGNDYLAPGNMLVHQFCSDFDLAGLGQ